MTNPDRPEPSGRRESIWSVAVEYKTLFYTIFTILNIVGMVYFAWYEIAINDQDSIHETIRNIILGWVAVFICSAGVTTTTTEVVVVIGTYLQERVFKPRRERMMAEARAKGLAEGLAEGRAEGLAEGLAEGRDEGLAEGLAEGRDEGRAEERKAISARMRRWNRRRLDAQAKGEPFDEPMPLEGEPTSANDTDSEDETR